jgi:hypothetical protein
MTKDSISIADYKDRANVLKLKVSATEKERTGIKERMVVVEDDYYIEGKMSEAQFNKRIDALNNKLIQTNSQLANYHKEIAEVEQMIQQLELPTNDKYLESILMLELDTEEYEDRKKIKDIMFQHIECISLREFKDGKHVCIEITILANNGVSFVFVYDTWLNCHRKNECCIFYKGMPLYFKDGAVYTLNKAVMDDIEVKAGLPILSNQELGVAAIHHIDRVLGIANDGTKRYRFTPDIVAVKNDIKNPEIVAAFKAKYNLTDDDIEFIDRTGDTFEVGTPSDKLVKVLNTLKGAGIIEETDEEDIPNLTLGYGVKF